VIGEYEWAFYGGHYASMAPLFEHYGIQLWTSEAGRRIGFQAEDHEETMLALGLQSKRQIARTRIRVRTAMAIQAREQTRYLGGRPPYGGTGWPTPDRTRTRSMPPGPPGAPAGAGPGYRAGGGVDVRPAADRSAAPRGSPAPSILRNAAARARRVAFDWPG